MPLKFPVAVLLTTLSLLVAARGDVHAQEIAPLMPLASKSLLLDISVAGSRLIVAGERGHILYSDDKGSHWQQSLVPTRQMLTSVYFVDAITGWAVGHDGLILVSEDGGENWRVQRDGLAAQQQAHEETRANSQQQIDELQQQLIDANEDTGAALELQLEDVRMQLEDAQFALSEPVFASPLMDVWFMDAKQGWAVGAFGTLLATRDGGQQWLSAQPLLENPEEFHLNAITGDSSGRVFLAGEGGVMFRSMDSGHSWEMLEPFYEGSWFGTVFDAQHDVLLVFGLRGNLFTSRDFGTTWEAVSTDSTATLSGGSVTRAGNITLVGGVGTVLRSEDGGRSFSLTTLEDRLSLSAGIEMDERLILTGQGGVKVREAANR